MHSERNVYMSHILRMLKIIFARPILRALLALVSICFVLTASSCSRMIQTEKEPPIGKRQQGQLSEYSFSEGMKEFILENYSQAISSFEKALSLNPEMSAANFMLGKIYFQSGKNAEALNYALKALKLGEKNKYYYLLTAQIYERQQNFAESAKIYKRLIAEIPGSEEHYYDLAASYIFQLNFDEALKVYTKIESLFGKSQELTRQKQQLFLKINKLDFALQEGAAYMAEFPEDNDFKITQAEILYSNNRLDEAAVFLENIIKEDPHNGPARLLLMEIFKSRGNLEKSNQQLEYIFNSPEVDVSTKLNVLDELKRNPSGETAQKYGAKYAELLVKNHPHDSKALIEAGDVFLMLEKKEIAWQHYIKAKSLDEADFNLWNKIILLDSDLNKPDSILVHSEQALELFPNQAVLWLYNGSGYLMKKENSRALDALETGLKLSANNQELQNEFNMRLGDCYNEVKEYHKSDQAFEEVLKNDKDNEHVLNNFSYYLSLRKEKLDLAKQMSEKLVAIHPDNATYLDTYAWVLYMLKDYENAKKYLEIAILNTNNATILEHYGDVLFQLGQKDKAISQWEKAKQMGEISSILDKKIKDKSLYEQ